MRLWLQPCGGATRFYAVTFTAIGLCRMDRKSTLHRAVKPVKFFTTVCENRGFVKKYIRVHTICNSDVLSLFSV